MRKSAFLFLMMVVLSGCKEPPLQYNGYIDADLIYLSSNFPGRLVEMLVMRGQKVQKNQLLFKVEQTSQHYALASATFNHDALIVQKKDIVDKLHYARLNHHRTVLMRQKNAASQQDLELSKQNLDILNNQLAILFDQIKASQMTLKQRQWDVLSLQNVATDKGLIFESYFTKGEYVQAGQPIVSLITPSHIKVVFFVPETDLNKIVLNQTVMVSSDGEPALAKGWVSYISSKAQYTPPMIYSREESHALVFRVEASIMNPTLEKVHLGQPVYLDLVR